MSTCSSLNLNRTLSNNVYLGKGKFKNILYGKGDLFFIETQTTRKPGVPSRQKEKFSSLLLREKRLSSKKVFSSIAPTLKKVSSKGSWGFDTVTSSDSRLSTTLRSSLSSFFASLLRSSGTSVVTATSVILPEAFLNSPNCP